MAFKGLLELAVQYIVQPAQLVAFDIRRFIRDKSM